MNKLEYPIKDYLILLEYFITWNTHFYPIIFHRIPIISTLIISQRKLLVAYLLDFQLK